MKELNNFDPRAFIEPKSRADLLALLREFRAEAARLQAHLDKVTEDCESALTV